VCPKDNTTPPVERSTARTAGASGAGTLAIKKNPGRVFKITTTPRSLDLRGGGPERVGRCSDQLIGCPKRSSMSRHGSLEVHRGCRTRSGLPSWKVPEHPAVEKITVGREAEVRAYDRAGRRPRSPTDVTAPREAILRCLPALTPEPTNGE